MAHVKVQRRSMRPEEYIALRYGWLKRYIYENKQPVTPVFIKEAHQIGDNSFEYYDSDYREINEGDMLYTPDGSAFFKFDCIIPNALSGQEVYLFMKTSSEIIVKINGRYAGGLDPNRSTVLISPFANNGVCKTEMYGFNRSKPDDERNPETSAGRGCRQIFGGIYTVTVNNAVKSLCYDCEALTDIIGSGAFSDEYGKIITERLNTALNMIDFDSDTLLPGQVLAAGQYIEQNIYADKAFKGSGRAALVAHSHLDLAYYWRRIHTVQKNLRTVLIQLRLMDKYPDYTYCHTQAYTYETLEKYYPEVFDELKMRIKEGRFEPVGAMYVEPDCNIPSAESLIRQCLYGQSYFRSRFGITVDSCWLPDVFGNSWILPQILIKSGVKYFVSNKMSTWNDTNRFPHNNFVWKGIDGTKIYACVPPTHFITWNEPSQIVENWEAFQDKSTNTETLSMFGYGDGGSGATEEMIELMHRFKKLSVMPETRHITAKRFLDENFTADKSFDVWDGELYLEMHRGTFTTKSELKKYNRLLETKFRDTELLCLLGRLIGKVYPAEKINELYKLFLVNQFHDILPGSHITPVYRDAIEDLKKIDSGLSGLVPKGEGLFNTLNISRGGIEFIEQPNGEFTRLNKQGGFYRVCAEPLSQATALCSSDNGEWFSLNGLQAETDAYSVSFAPDGSIVSLFDKKLCREWVKGAFNKLRLYDDKPGNYDAWDILPDYAVNECSISVETPLHFVKKNGICAELSAELITSSGSRLKHIIRLFKASEEIEVECIANWQEKHKLLKVHFEPDILTRELVCDTSAGYIKREMNVNTTWQQAKFECCTHKWFSLDETGAGVAVINNSKYGAGITPNGASLSLLRATERPDPVSDIGMHDFCWKIVPHGGSFTDAKINDLALIYNSPLIYADIENAPDFMRINGLFLQSAKLSENGKMAVLRLCEQNGRRGSINFNRSVKLLNMLEDEISEVKSISYSPFEIITLGINID